MARIRQTLVLIGSGSIAAALAAQVTPPGPGPGPVPGAGGPDIVVNGAMPRMVAGLWRFRSGTRLTDPVPGQRQAPPQRWQAWDRCIADGDTPAIVDQLIGAQAGIQASEERGTLCSALKLSIDRTRAVGSRRCSVAISAGPALQITTGLRATIAETRLSADYVEERGSFGGSSRITRWQVTAERIGDCPGAPPTAVPTVMPPPVAVVAPTTAATPVSSKSAEPTIARVSSVTPTDRGAPAPSPTASPAPETASPPEDIVVIARRLRRLRLHYGVDGNAVRWCHADVSSGDKRVDRIGCAIVRACTKSGADTVEATLACFRRRVDSLDPPA